MLTILIPKPQLVIIIGTQHGKTIIVQYLSLNKMSEHPTSYEYVSHPEHYGGENNPYEAIKVIEAWDLDFHLGNTVKYISRAGKKGTDKELQDLKKALWYLQRKIENLEK
jgi:hypothetical protein